MSATMQTLDEIVFKENESIREFIQEAAFAGFIRGRVLDFGCGREPYRQIVEEEIAKGTASSYEPYDRPRLYPHSMAPRDVGGWPDDGVFTTVICTQVIQYVPSPSILNWLRMLRRFIGDTGTLLLTGPTNWPDINDLHRLTIRHVHTLLIDAGFDRVNVSYREPEFAPMLPYGYKALAHA